MENGKFKIGDDGEIEPIIDDSDFEGKPKRKRKTKQNFGKKLLFAGLLLVVILTSGFIFTRPEYQLFACRKFDSCGLIPYEPFYIQAPACNVSPVISDAKIVFVYRPLSQWQQIEDGELFIQDVNSAAICRFTDNSNVDETQPVWSFDGQQIAYVSSNSMLNFEGVVTFGADGSIGFGVVFPGDDYVNFMRPEWSPASYDLMVHNDQKETIIRSEEQRWYSKYTLTQDRVWSAQGAAIAFIAEDDLFIGDKTLQQARRIVIHDFYNLHEVAWIPNSRKVVFAAQSYDLNGNLIVMVDVDTEEITSIPLKFQSATIMELKAAPDGTKLAVQLQYTDASTELHNVTGIMSLADGSVSVVPKNDTGHQMNGFWLGDSQSMVFIDYPGLNVPEFKLIDLNNPANSRSILAFNHSTMGIHDFDVWSKPSAQYIWR